MQINSLTDNQVPRISNVSKPSQPETDKKEDRSSDTVLKEDEKKEAKTQEVSEKAVIDAIEKANKALKSTQTNLKFSIHEKTKQIMVKVINSETNEIIRELPPEKVLDMVAKMWEISGLFVDEKR